MVPREQLLAYYTEICGFPLVRLHPRSKAPLGGNGWPDLPPARPAEFGPSDNVGTKVGAHITVRLDETRTQSGCLTDLDLDSEHAIVMAKRLLLNDDRLHTPFQYGRDGRLHAMFLTPDALPSEQFRDVRNEEGGDGKMLLEIRGLTKAGTVGAQTMLPGSIHPDTGEEIAFRGTSNGKVPAPPAYVENAQHLRQRAVITAVGALLRAHLGPRALDHHVRLALAAFLYQCQVDPNDIIAIEEALIEHTGNTDHHDIAPSVWSTVDKIKTGKRVKGESELVSNIGKLGQAVVTRIREWLNVADFLRHPRSGAIIDISRNYRKFLDKLGITLRYDAFKEIPLVTWGDRVAHLTDKLSKEIVVTIEDTWLMRPTKTAFDNFLEKAATEQTFHPVKDYLESVKWDGVKRLDDWLITYGRAINEYDKETEPENYHRYWQYVRAVSALPLIGAIRRVYQPGCKFDEMLTLESQQGSGKSTGLRALCPNPEWFTDHFPLNASPQEVIEQTGGKWIIESPELVGLRERDVERMKAMLSRGVDGPVRRAYAHLTDERPRQFIVIGTTNSRTYLRDATGGRRFWPVRVGVLDVEGIKRDRDQLWAEALLRARDPQETGHLDPSLWAMAAEQQSVRRVTDPWEAEVEAVLVKKYGYHPDIACQQDDIRVTQTEMYEALNMPLHERDNGRLTEVMESLGFTHKVSRLKGEGGNVPSKRRYVRNRAQLSLARGEGGA